ncbi:M48 family metallopeptidase [Candidatus Clostridium radicumherbarum]|uniref:M48 family metallopeptidase n=1 Tax=Candidatus Clostridium radicumherbarum TaxID=3381662 RepID=A0ABW8TVI0_9CLOT
MKITIENKEVSVIVIRKNRKTISIKISSPTEIIVSAPLFINNEKIIEVLKNKETWIAEKLNSIKTDEKRDFREGILFLGTSYRVIIQNVKHNSLKLIFDKSSFNVYVPEKLTEEDKLFNIKGLLIKWYINNARRIFQDRVNFYSNILNVRPKRIAIKDQKSRWGSCSSKGNINLNYRLIMAPMEVMDYVIVHELCHLIHLNHSKEFWALVKEVFPSYLKCKEWLKINGNSLNL